MDGLSGFSELEKELEEYAKQSSSENISKVLQVGADAFVKDLLALPKPRSQIAKGGYTHLIDTFSDEKDPQNENAWVIGWGKYYGPILEHGSQKMSAQAHLKPCWESNKENYYKLMQEQLGGK